MDLKAYLADRCALIDRALAGSASRHRQTGDIHKGCVTPFCRPQTVAPRAQLAAAEALRGEVSRGAAPGVCRRVIHTYSLIHDDLPCMDDDDCGAAPTSHNGLRRRRGVLAGDALLTVAFEILVPHRRDARAIKWPLWVRELAVASGSRGSSAAGGRP